MARLISKVVRSTTNGIDDDGYSRSWNKSHSQNTRPNNQKGNSTAPHAYSGETKRSSGIMSNVP